MTRNFIMYIVFLIFITILHYLGVYDFRIFSIIGTVIIAVLLIGGHHTAMRRYSSIDQRNAEYDASHLNDEPSLETIIKVCVPLVLFLILIFCK